jgi:hypothetical protein
MSDNFFVNCGIDFWNKWNHTVYVDCSKSYIGKIFITKRISLDDNETLTPVTIDWSSSTFRAATDLEDTACLIKMLSLAYKIANKMELLNWKETIDLTDFNNLMDE